MSTSSEYDVIIAGGGPAGSSAAIHLAMRGARVLLVEQKKFPRPKLCGEFISPECQQHFDRLAVTDQMLASHPATLTDTVFYSRHGNSVTVPSSWFGSNRMALGLSRAEMDERLMRRAEDAGADVVEQATVSNLITHHHRVAGATVKHHGKQISYTAAVTIDATGRARSLTRQLSSQTKSRRPPMVAFKVHLEDAGVAAATCEIYFYRGGYGGLSSIENGLSNLCFIAAAKDVRACAADADRVMREVVCQNRRAALTLKTAQQRSPWLAVSLEGFGRNDVAPAEGLLAVGDAASFIDPFTGSGMLMALESGELAANLVGDYLESKVSVSSTADLRVKYDHEYELAFTKRLRICVLLRRAAFVPGLAELAIRAFAGSDRARRRLARATRGTAAETYFPA
jgi:flavin-dependent dehydrogenase